MVEEGEQPASYQDEGVMELKKARNKPTAEEAEESVAEEAEEPVAEEGAHLMSQ